MDFSLDNENYSAITSANSSTCQLEDYQVNLLCGVRGGCAAVCAIIYTVLLGVTCWCMNRRFFEHRLLVYLILVSLLNLLANISQFVVLGRNSLDHNIFNGLCTTVATLTQFTAWLQILVAAWILIYFWFSYGQPSYDYYDPHRALRRCKREILPLCGTVVWAAFIAIVPAITEKYGMIYGWCWIQNQCNDDPVGIAEQWILYYGWLIILLVCAPVVLIIGVCRSRQIARMSEGIAVQTAEIYRRKARASAIVLTAYILVYLLFYLYDLCLVITDVSKTIPFGMWIIDAATISIRTTVLPLLALLYLYCTGKFPALARTHNTQSGQSASSERDRLVTAHL